MSNFLYCASRTPSAMFSKSMKSAEPLLDRGADGRRGRDRHARGRARTERRDRRDRTTARRRGSRAGRGSSSARHGRRFCAVPRRRRGGACAFFGPVRRGPGTKSVSSVMNSFPARNRRRTSSAGSREDPGDLHAPASTISTSPTLTRASLLDDPRAAPQTSPRARRKKMDRQVGGGEPHLAVEVGGEREGDRGVGQRREDPAVHRPRAVGDLAPVRKLRAPPGPATSPRGSHPSHAEGRRDGQPRPQPLQKVRRESPQGSPDDRCALIKRLILRGNPARRRAAPLTGSSGPARRRRRRSTEAPPRGESSCRGASGPRRACASRSGSQSVVLAFVGVDVLVRVLLGTPRSSGRCRSCRT